MGRREEESEVTLYDGVGGKRCDESKCVSKGRGNLFGDSNTCFGDVNGTVFPMMCADGFLPVIVEDEPPELHTDWWGSFPVSYFTCCPPDEITSNATLVARTRECSDPIRGFFDAENAEENTTVVCDDPTRKYPRQMETSWGVLAIDTFGITPSKTDSYLCCDSDLAETNKSSIGEDYLEKLECVPYRNEVYEFKKAKNLVGLLRVITCDFPEGDFVFPRPMDGKTFDDVASSGNYQCCRSGPALPPFIHDDAFKLTVYIPVALWCLTFVVSLIVSTALLIPLLLQLRNGKLNQSRASTSLRRRPQRQYYSTYNLYLVYLFLFDLIFSLFQIGWYGSYINQKFNPNFYSVAASPTNLVYTVTIIRAPDGPFTYAYVFINMWINVIISWQLLVLLRMTKRAVRMRQPSLTRINIQVGALFLISVIYGYILYLLSDASSKAGESGDFATVERLSTTVQVIWLFMMTFPILCVGVIFFLIWWGNYIPSLDAQSSTKDKALKQLFFFFLRIVAIFYGVWFPALVLLIVGIVKFTTWYYLLAWSLVAIQPILSACMILTKFDVKKYIFDFITLSYLFGAETERSSIFVGITALGETSRTPSQLVGGGGNPASHENDDSDEKDDENSALYYSVLGFTPGERENRNTESEFG